MICLVKPVCARFLSLLNSIKYDSSLISVPLGQLTVFEYLRINFSIQLQFSFFLNYFFCLCSYSFKIFRIIYLCSYSFFFPELILHKYSVGVYLQSLVNLFLKQLSILADVRAVRVPITLECLSVNIHRQRSSDISVIKEELLDHAHSCAHSLAILSIQEPKSWDVSNLELLEYVCYGSKSGFATLVVFRPVLHNYEIMEVGREMYSSALRKHPGDGGVRSRLK